MGKFSALAALAAMGRVVAGALIPQPSGAAHQSWRIAAGRNYVSRSYYTPGGPNRNCGDRGISPKSVARRARA